MSMTDAIDAVKKKIKQIQRNHQFKQNNKKTQWEAHLTKELMDCAGDLGVCRARYETAIRRQSEEIREGMKNGYPIEIQKNLLMNAAVGYMMIKDAMFVIRSVSTYDSIENAYALLDMATKTITGEKVKKPKLKKHPTREEYAFLNSFETVESKKKIVESSGFMEMLIATGDIEKCMAAAKENTGAESEQDKAVAPMEPHLEESDTSIGMSPEDMKILKMMQQSTSWSSRQTYNAPSGFSSPDGTNTPPPVPPTETGPETGGEES